MYGLCRIFLMTCWYSLLCVTILPVVDRRTHEIVQANRIIDVVDPYGVSMEEYRTLLLTNLKLLNNQKGADYIEQDAIQEARDRIQKEIVLVDKQIKQGKPSDEEFYELEKTNFLKLMQEFVKPQANALLEKKLNANIEKQLDDIFKKIYKKIGGGKAFESQLSVPDDRLSVLAAVAYEILVMLNSPYINKTDGLFMMAIKHTINKQKKTLGDELKDIKHQLSNNQRSVRANEKVGRNTLADNPIIFFASKSLRSAYVLAMINVIEAYIRLKDSKSADDVKTLLKTIVNDRWGGQSKFGIDDEAYKKLSAL